MELNLDNFFQGEINNLKFIDLYNDYIQFKSIKLKYQSILKIQNKFKNHILPFFKNYMVKDINHHVYLKWMLEIDKKNFSFSYISSLHLSMVNILNYAVKFYHLSENVATKVGNFNKGKSIKKKIDFWTYEEYKKFIVVVDDKIYKLFFQTLFYTGLRQGEALALTWNDFSNSCLNINKTISKTKINNQYVINSPKTPNSNRTIDLDKNLNKQLIKLYNESKKNKLFSKNWFIFGGINPLSPTTIGRKKDKYCKIANVKKIRIHDFRHSHATLLLSSGVPITVISQRLGHSDIAMTLNTYSHLIQKDKEKAIEILNKLNQC